MYSVVFVYYCMLAIVLVQLSDNSIEIIKLDQMSLLAAISFSGLCYAIRSITIPSVSFSCCKRFLLIILCTAYLTRRSFACATVLWESSASYFSVSFCAVGAVATFALLAAIPCLWIHSNFESVWISQSISAGLINLLLGVSVCLSVYGLLTLKVVIDDEVNMQWSCQRQVRSELHRVKVKDFLVLACIGVCCNTSVS